MSMTQMGLGQHRPGSKALGMGWVLFSLEALQCLLLGLTEERQAWIQDTQIVAEMEKAISFCHFIPPFGGLGVETVRHLSFVLSRPLPPVLTPQPGRSSLKSSQLTSTPPHQQEEAVAGGFCPAWHQA